jgi:DNA-binding NarL/FixJ family response regulator
LPGGGHELLGLRERVTLLGGQAAAARKRLEALTEREREVVVAVAQGLSDAEIGRRRS